jgi:hypothetical protein
MSISRPVVNKAESPGGPVPSEQVLVAWANATGADLSEFVELAMRAKSGTPEWFMPYLSAEQEAGHLRLWSPLVVPGLLQTEAYARCLLSARRRTAEQLQALVDQRIERRQVIARADVTAVMDYRVLVHAIGSPAVMTEQCAYLAELVERYAVSLHVVPEGANVGLTAPFDISSRGAVVTVCLAASSRDITSTAPDVIDENVRLFDAILGASMPVVQSLEYVRQREEIWKEQA